MKSKMFLLIAVALLVHSVDITPATAQQWGIGSPIENEGFNRAASIPCTGPAPAVGVIFSLRNYDCNGFAEQGVTGTTAGPNMPGMAMWGATLTPPQGQNYLWTSDLFIPPVFGPFGPIFGGWMTNHSIRLIDANAAVQKNRTIFINTL